MEMYKSNRISLKALNKIPYKLQQEISSVIEDLVFNDKEKKFINENKIKIFKADIDILPFTLYDKEIEYFIKNSINIVYSNISVLDNYNPIEGGETSLYYLRLRFKGKAYYKVGVTLRDVKSRYTKKDLQFIEKIIYEKKLTHANTIEQKILKDYQNSIFPLAILSSGHSEVFDYDVLGLDI